MFGLAFVLVSLSAEANTGGNDDVRSALVKIYTSSQTPNFGRPWTPGTIDSSTGSGCVISERRILTNAHVVSDQTFVQVRRNGQADKHVARVLFVSHEADLAVLTVDDARFFEGIKPLEVGALPTMRQEVSVLGFPEGGDTLSVTRGVVSRIEHHGYVHSGRHLLAGQIDAAINPGNSGGPVTDGARLVGVAMQNIPSLDNVAYMIPQPVIDRFLEDIADGRYDGVPRLGVRWQPLENPALKRRYEVSGGLTGVLVTGIYPGSPAAEFLQENDILLSVDGHRIANDGTVEFRSGERTAFTYFIDVRQAGQGVAVSFLRQGQMRSGNLVLRWLPGAGELIRERQYDSRPPYFIFGGVTFVPLTRNYLHAYGPEWYRDAPDALLAAQGILPAEAGEQVVLIAQVLPADVNEGYHDVRAEIVRQVDGVKPRDLRHLVELLEGGESEFVAIAHGAGRQLVLDRALARATNGKILRQYQIESDRSADLSASEVRRSEGDTPAGSFPDESVTPSTEVR